MQTFEDLQLHSDILKAVFEAGYSEPTKIQLQAIPQILKKFDLRASAQTGTGKTAAFLLPALHNLTVPARSGKGPRILILVPTRELALQISAQSEKYSRYLNRIKTVCIYGGIPYPKQIREVSKPYDILIATPGRLIDLIDRKKIQFSRLEMLVLDEADRMLDMGFLDPVKKIIAKTPKNRQTLFFSATLGGSIIKLSNQLLHQPQEIVTHSKREKHDNIEQKLHYVDNRYHKNQILDHLLSEGNIGHAIVFTSTKRHADQLGLELHNKGYPIAVLHGDMNQRQRTRTIKQFKTGKIKILVATDVAARGIDVQSITHVINFDLPRAVEDYIHRIGRTGRAGANGLALSFAERKETFLVKKIEKFIGQPICVSKIKGLEPSEKKSTPSRKKRGQRVRRSFAAKKVHRRSRF